MTAATSPLLTARRHTVDLDLTGGRPGQAEDDVDRRRLPGTVGAEKGHDLSGLDHDVNAAHRFDVAEAFVHTPQLEGGRKAAADRGTGGRAHVGQRHQPITANGSLIQACALPAIGRRAARGKRCPSARPSSPGAASATSK
jgi:hypothetical protein